MIARFVVGLFVVSMLALPLGAQQPAQDTGAGGAQKARDPELVNIRLLPVAQRLQMARERYRGGKAALDLLDRNKHFRAAIDILDDILKERPAEVEAEVLWGEILLDGNQYNEASEHFSRVVKHLENNNYRANLGLGKIWIANRVYRQAIPKLEIAVANAPEDRKSEALVQLALANRFVGDQRTALEMAKQAKEEAERAIQKVRQRPSTSPIPAMQDRVFAIQLRAEIESYLAGNVSTQDTSRWADARGSASELVDAARELATALQGEPEGLQALDAAYTSALTVLGYGRAGTGYVQNLYELDPKTGKATDRLKVGKEREAARLLMEATEWLREQAEVRRLLARQPMIELVKQACKYELDNIDYRDKLIALHREVGDLLKEFEASKGLVDFVDNAQNAAELRDLPANKAAYDRAKAFVESPENRANYHRLLARKSLRDNDLTAAYAEYQEVLKFVSDDPEATLFIGTNPNSKPPPPAATQPATTASQPASTPTEK